MLPRMPGSLQYFLKKFLLTPGFYSSCCQKSTWLYLCLTAHCSLKKTELERIFQIDQVVSNSNDSKLHLFTW